MPAYQQPAPTVTCIHLMTSADLDLAMRLKSQAGWNQVEADWRRFLAIQPDGCFVAELNGVAVGTAVGCVFGTVAWIAMVLVDSAVRGRGVGTALVEHALAFVERQGAASVRLDATPLGRPLYEKLGFEPQYSLTRFGGELEAVPQSPSQNDPSPKLIRRAAPPDDYESILALDRSVTHTDRRKFLLWLFDERPNDLWIVEHKGHVEGYCAFRPGSNAWQFGPCIAAPDAGEYVLTAACQRLPGQRIYWDLPTTNVPAMRFAQAIGLEPQRELLRMCRGAQINDDCERLWASSGPELG